MRWATLWGEEQEDLSCWVFSRCWGCVWTLKSCCYDLFCINNCLWVCQTLDSIAEFDRGFEAVLWMCIVALYECLKYLRFAWAYFIFIRLLYLSRVNLLVQNRRKGMECCCQSKLKLSGIDFVVPFLVPLLLLFTGMKQLVMIGRVENCPTLLLASEIDLIYFSSDYKLLDLSFSKSVTQQQLPRCATKSLDNLISVKMPSSSSLDSVYQAR